MSRLGPLFFAVVVPAAITFPLVTRLRRGLFAWDFPPLARSGIVPADHLVNLYRFWLFSDDVARRTLRLHDPYAFALVGKAHDPPLGWVFGPVFAVLDRIAGPVAAYNLLVLLALALTVVFGYVWLRALGVSPQAATVGAVAMAVFPPAYAHLTVHIKAFFFWLMPLALFCVERARRAPSERMAYAWGAAAGVAATVLVTVIEPETGIYFWPVLVVYAIGRARRGLWFGLGTGLGLTAAYTGWFYAAVIGPSVNSGGRSLTSLLHFSPSIGDLFTRSYDPTRIEHYIWPGLAGFAAVYGGVRLWRSMAPLGAKLAVALAPLIVLAAMGPKAPVVGRLYRVLFEHLSAFRVVQTPGRVVFVLVPLVGLGVAFALPWLSARRWAWLACLPLVGLLVLDARAVTWRQSRPLPRQITAAAAGARGIIDLPVTNGLDFLGGVYDYGITAMPSARTGGQSPFVTQRQITGFNRVVSLGGGTIEPGAVAAACEMGATHVIVWEDLFGRGDLPRDGAAVVRSLRASPNFQLLVSSKGIDIFALRC